MAEAGNRHVRGSSYLLNDESVLAGWHCWLPLRGHPSSQQRQEGLSQRFWKKADWTKRTAEKTLRNWLQRTILLLFASEYLISLSFTMVVFLTSGAPDFDIQASAFPNLAFGAFVFYPFFILASWIWELQEDYFLLQSTIHTELQAVVAERQGREVILVSDFSLDSGIGSGIGSKLDGFSTELHKGKNPRHDRRQVVERCA
eukprot:GEMP01057829.1.p1 GENE.GEMP01057829.1~~GEMP01057829.1.p1  ORF type:complete len:201 (+),score=22.85 GEMP01057829.1:143-745(+)